MASTLPCGTAGLPRHSSCSGLLAVRVAAEPKSVLSGNVSSRHIILGIAHSLPMINGSRVPYIVPRKNPWLARQRAVEVKCVVTTDSSAVKKLVGMSEEGPEVDLIFPQITDTKRVVLVRHGESTWNSTGRIQGSSDFSVLTAKGESQAETSRQMLIGDKFEVCFHSPLKRSARTAEIIWDSRKEPMVPLDDLREIDLYSFQGLMKEEGKAKFGEAYLMWQKDAVNFVIDGHYPVRELWDRARMCWSTMLQHPAKTILVVAHNAVNQALVATATGLGPEYFRQLLQSNCGVSVLDFSPRTNGGPPYVSLNRLNQTPSPPIAVGQTAGRRAKSRVVLVCHGATNSSAQDKFPLSDEENLNMLGVIQSRKTAELLLDVRVDTLICSPLPRAVKTALAIAEVQEAADCLGVDCVPRYLDLLELPELRDLEWGAWRGLTKAGISQQERWEELLEHSPPEAEGAEGLGSLWGRASRAWDAILEELARPVQDQTEGSEVEVGPKTIVVVGHEMVYRAILGHLLKLTQACIGSFHLDTGSLSVFDFPEGPLGKGVVRCLNYTAHLGRWAVPVTRPTANEEDF